MKAYFIRDELGRFFDGFAGEPQWAVYHDGSVPCVLFGTEAAMDDARSILVNEYHLDVTVDTVELVE